jgi:DNA-binding LacI/PurR family transcriptional regulator
MQKNVVPLYEELAGLYRQAILARSLGSGDRVDSINEIQAKHRVSRETAKRVLGVLAEEGLITQRAGKGSFVADLGPKQQVWGVVLPFYSIQFQDLIGRFSYLAASLDREVRHFCDYNNWEEEIRLVGMMLSQHYEATIVIPTTDESRTRDFYSRLSPRELSVVLLNHTMTHNAFPSVIQSYDLGVVRAISYLAGQREGNIAFIRDDLWAGRNLVQELMEGTYLAEMQKLRPELRPLILNRAGQVQAAVLERHGVRGIFSCDDTSAIQVIGRLREEGVRVPEDIRLVSYGNTDLARFFTPAITSVDPHNEEMAADLIELLRPLVAGERIPIRQYIAQPDLVVRHT